MTVPLLVKHLSLCYDLQQWYSIIYVIWWYFRTRYKDDDWIQAPERKRWAEFIFGWQNIFGWLPVYNHLSLAFPSGFQLRYNLCLLNTSAWTAQYFQYCQDLSYKWQVMGWAHLASLPALVPICHCLCMCDIMTCDTITGYSVTCNMSPISSQMKEARET